MKDKVRLSGESPYPSELEVYCKKLETIATVFDDVIKSAAGFRKEIVSSINILESMRDSEELMERLKTIRKFLDMLIQLYESNLQRKQFVVGECSISISYFV
jgi:hypothetical protein